MAAYQFSLIRPVTIGDSGSFNRITIAWYFDKTGTLVQAASGAPRFAYDPITLAPTGMLLEASATNLIRNNSAAGITAGTIGAGGVAPTNTVTGTNASGLSVAVSSGTENGFTYTDYRFFGTATAATEAYFGLETNNPPGIAAAINDQLAFSVYGRLVAGSFANVNSGVLRLQPVTNVGAVTGAALDTADMRSALSAATGIAKNRMVNANTIPSGYTGTTGVFPVFAFGHSTGAIDFTIRVGGAQVEKGTLVPSSVLLTTNAAFSRTTESTSALMLSNVAETAGTTDPALWAAATAYTVGQQASRIIQGGIHKVYQRLVAGTTASLPENDPTNWVYVGPTNKYRMFDTTNETQTSNADDIVVVLKPGVLVDTLMFDNMDADSIRVVVANSTYDQTIQLKTRACTNWFQYFFETFKFKKTAVFMGLPLVTTNIITVIIRKATLTAKAGTCVLGQSRALGYAEPGATVGIIDYSTKSTDQFGSTNVVQRSYSKRMNVSVIIQNTDLDDVQELLASYRATPVAWIAAGNLYSSLSVFGYYRSFDIVIAYPNQSRCNLEIEGLT